MDKKSFLILLALSLPLPAAAQVVAINGNMDATMSRGQFMTFQFDLVAGSQGYSGPLTFKMHGDDGIGFSTVSSDSTAMPCSGDKSGSSCRGSVTLAPGAKIHVSQTILIFKDTPRGPQLWKAELVGDFLSGSVVREGTITLTDKRARIVMERAPDVMLQTPGGFAGTILVLKNVGDAPGDARVTEIDPDNLVTINNSFATVQPGAMMTVGLLGNPGVPLGEHPGTLQVDRTLDEPILVKIRVDVADRPDGTPQPVAPSRLNILNFAAFLFNLANSGTGDLVGVLTSDAAWVVPPPGIFRIRPGESKSFTGSIDQSQFPGDSGSTSGTMKVIFFRGGSGKGLRPFDSPGTSTVSISLVATVPPPVTGSAIPPLEHRCQTIGCWDEVALFVPGVGHVAGSVGLFISDVTLFPNVGPGTGGAGRSLSGVDMYFTPLGASSTAAKKVNVDSVNPPSSVAFADMVSNVYGVEQLGSLQIRAPGFLPDYVVGVNANVFNVSNRAGTYGTSLPMFQSYSGAKGSDRVSLTGLRKDATSHTNLYLQEVLGFDINVNIDFYDAPGNKTGSTSANVPAFAAVSLPSSVIPSGTVSAILGVSGGNGALHAFATPVDEASGDTWVVADWSRVYSYYQSYLPPTGVNALIPVAGAAPGANNTHFKTDAAIMNVGTTPATGTLRYFIRGGQTIQKTINLNGFQTQIFDDITTNFFGITDANVGYMTYTPATGRVAITSRNYTTTPGSAATFGTAVPTLPLRTVFGNGGSSSGAGISNGGTLRMSGIEDAVVGSTQPGAFRSNFGLVEVGGQPATVLVTIYYNTNTDKTSVTQGASATVTLAPNEFKLIGSIANTVLGADRSQLGDLHNITVEFKVIDGTGRVVPFISSVDNGSGDSTFRVN